MIMKNQHNIKNVMCKVSDLKEKNKILATENAELENKISQANREIEHLKSSSHHDDISKLFKLDVPAPSDPPNSVLILIHKN